ncbi:MAG: hypothetical protein M1814_003409 [Vezdaea aestivalis]|nr:MAG: hypothetical protein M1814_003409 [Vezdaea aestivalis]
MGNDGGSIPTRRELVKEAAKNPTTSELKETRQEQQAYNWSNCLLSNKRLTQPIVSDCEGRLYNKEAVLHFLLPSDDESNIRDKEDMKAVVKDRILGLRDIVEVKFVDDATSKTTGRWVCPITNKPLGPKTRTVYLVPCGHAFSETALRETTSDTCPQCNEGFFKDNVILILPTLDADIQMLTSRMAALRAKGMTHSLRKAPNPGKKKKRKKGVELELEKKSASKTLVANAALNGIKNPATASLTAKVIEDEKTGSKRRKLDMNENIKGLFSAKNKGGMPHDTADFMTRGFTIPGKATR